jgi:hypothetical protein
MDKDQMKKGIQRISAGSEELETKGTVCGDDGDEMVAVSARNSSGELAEHLLGLIECERFDCTGLKESLR